MRWMGGQEPSKRPSFQVVVERLEKFYNHVEQIHKKRKSSQQGEGGGAMTMGATQDPDVQAQAGVNNYGRGDEHGNGLSGLLHPPVDSCEPGAPPM